MKGPKLAKADQARIDRAVGEYERRRSEFESDAANLQNRILANKELKQLVHSVKWRAKDPGHLKDKLRRKIELGRQIDLDNIFEQIPDLAGVRILHLHMRQMEQLHPLLQKLFTDEGYVLHEDPEAKTWDPEYASMFRDLNLKVVQSESLYTSVHYVVKQNSTTKRLCELQVRSLAEELWGEVSHTINYPHETGSVACKEQLRVLARLVSGCSRLVDSIVTSLDEYNMKGPDSDAVSRKGAKVSRARRGRRRRGA